MAISESNRADITSTDVFISWTGKNKDLKDRIKKCLLDGELICTDSEKACQGDFEQWSKEAAISSTVFLMVLTEETTSSVYVPKELECALSMDDAPNRIIVVCSDYSLYENLPFSYGNINKNALTDRKISAIIMPEGTLTDGILDEIYQKTVSLVINRFDKIYREKTKPDYVKLISLYRAMQNTSDREFSYDDLYIPRTVTERDEKGDVTASYGSPGEFVKSRDIFFLCGPGGSGKTQYIDQIRKCVDDSALLIALSCSKAASSGQPLFKDIYSEFCRVLGNADYFTEDHFKRLLSVKHLMLVLDGMDEIGTEEGTRAFLQKVEQYYKPNAGKTTLFFTGRNIKTADSISMNGQKPRKLHLCKLTDEEIKTLGNHLFLLFEAENKANAFYVSIRDLNEEIKSNPLLLSQLAIIYKDSGKVPETVVGIFDAISEIILRMDKGRTVTDIPDAYKDMIRNIGSILKEFSKERYRLISEEKSVAPVKIFSKILGRYEDKVSRAEFLMGYLQNRAILADGEFFHKMFLEYFTAVYYYEHTFDDYDELEDTECLCELFSHYSDPYWAQVIQLYLIKADSCIDCEMTNTLYREIITAGKVSEYTLLFDSCRDLICHKEEAEVALVTDILYKSAEKIYPPYGPLFWYVPEYKLYEAALLAAEKLKGNAKALALARDVCYIYGQKNHSLQITDKVNGKALYEAAKAQLSGVRKALLEIFLLGDTDYESGKDVYPRFFNVTETLSFRDHSCGVGGRMPTPFEDELGLYEHTAYNELSGEFIGLISCPYDDRFEEILRAKNTYKVNGLSFSPAERTKFEEPKFYNGSVRVLFYPENIIGAGSNYDVIHWRNLHSIIDCAIGKYGLVYLYGKVSAPLSIMKSVMENGGLKYCSNIIEIHIPKGVTMIGGDAFYTCSSLIKIYIPESVTSIEWSAFEGCSSLKDIHIPESVTEIGEDAFNGCSSLKDIHIPEGVTEIGDNAFEGCSSLEDICIPESVVRIGNRAFEGCSSLEKIRIPESVIRIGNRAFEGCSSLEKIRIPESVIRIGNVAFEGCSSLKDIYIPESVTEIGEDAFNGCSSLKDIHIPEGVTEIGEGAFIGCSSLEKIRIPESVTRIGWHTFEGCISLKGIHIPQGVTEIGRSAFYSCISLKEIHIPQGVTEIGDNAFEGCSSLEDICIPESVIRIGNRAFEGCRPKNICIPQRFESLYSCIGFGFDCKIEWIQPEEKIIVIPENAKEIESEAYINSTATKIVIPSSVTAIGGCAFSGCSNLKEIRIPEGVMGIGDYAFEGCTSLKEIRIPESVTIIGDGAFIGCSSLEEIRIFENVIRIGNRAFEDCNSLEVIHIPKGVTEIGWSAFEGCSSLEKIHIPESVTKTGTGVFKGCSSLKNIHIPEGVTEIGESAFKGCSSLEVIHIPKGVTVIGWSAFEGCSSLEKIHIPESVIRIGNVAFEGCSSLKDIHIPESVTEIGAYAFRGCSNLEEIRIPERVIRIGNRAFEGCSNLKDIHIPEGVTVIGEGAFKGCSSLKEIHIPETIEVIKNGAFNGCRSLKGIHIPKDVTIIGGETFFGCSSLEEIHIPKDVTIIGGKAFFGCGSLKGIHIPKDVTIIGGEAFFGCSSLEEIHIPEGVTKIGKSSFEACSSLTEIKIPVSVYKIEDNAFANCTGLKSVTIGANFKNDIERIFGSIDKSIIHFV